MLVYDLSKSLLLNSLIPLFSSLGKQNQKEIKMHKSKLTKVAFISLLFHTWPHAVIAHYFRRFSVPGNAQLVISNA